MNFLPSLRGSCGGVLQLDSRRRLALVPLIAADMASCAEFLDKFLSQKRVPGTIRAEKR
jgi:hypothetical protein